ncbi:hypothetical protein A3C09_02305 [Candidatus Uhrbacteria bacterium RIFCSPHIGHO2_02_FULL_47_44]|uniref:DUF2062 domain-containing protein n=1 Tax=Candidatus Uhrbacteria bacterium RIFCSPLOWO2_02_FULL_48_18 TaxID=1802408 RepID=A0A1F7V761_9BACT|nr:MAG: hypothetical protein A2839_01495 [Candidatus Uhrbacteria bacterium RIFCSPHIGHO2_01_FULL_47_10]OGL71188.1 MAG: hypothetical protein A3C09_02305 [Candidatus Uhrbacteria bacterium RIFCSPHIGHO2_02_FULL_47_44]OGL77257.1 MAG: hypothetical protein A3E97_01145 [Candidatus Uhrbacteria bacterium RIFCSPHIGHO2_12_FULL_47_12]OGL80483.1 MAG: hypothetical protein A3B20_03690 [Candidatus Uhrbacteria bacterium RIFCSPLOWO2_01_FULL_47_17]OGL86343.1 MAG: hypothetical protein A3I41_02170 [Candidatus Uhrbact
MSALNTQKTGLALGGLLGLIHLVWSVVVALGLGQSLVDWIMKIHMVEATHTVLPFALPSAITLIVLTTLVGYVVGYAFATIWNKVQK